MLRQVRLEFAQARYLMGYLALQTVGQAVTMAVPMAIAWLFSKELFGRYSASETLLFFFVTLFATSSRTALIVFASQERAETGSISKTFSVQLALLAAGMGAFVLIITVFHESLRVFAGVTLGELVLLGVACIGWTVKESIVTTFFAMNRRLKTALVEIVFGCSALAALALCYLLGITGLKAVFLSYGLGSAGAAAIGLAGLPVELLVPIRLDKGHFKGVFAFSTWTLLGAMSAYLINWGGLAFIRGFTSFLETGTYSMALKLSKGVMALVYIIPAYFLPHISETINNVESLRSYLYKKRPRILLLGMAGLVFAYVITPSMLRLLYRDKFMECVSVVRILLIGAAAFLHSVFYATLFSALKEYKFTQAAAVSQVVVNMILNFILIPFMGMHGAAIAAAAAFVYLSAISEAYFRLKLKKRLLAPQQPQPPAS